jgi:hypothetical protein
MKKIAFGCLAVVLAVAVSAFTAPKHAANLVYYFPLNDDGTPETLSYIPPTVDTWECPGEISPCSAGYPGYTSNGSGLYQASGTMVAGTEEYED